MVPRAGWFAQQPNATFSLRLSNVTMTTSHGPVHEELRAAVGGIEVGGTRAGGTSGPERSGGEEDEEATLEIDGYHNTTTYVHFPHKLLLPGGPARGDTILSTGFGHHVQDHGDCLLPDLTRHEDCRPALKSKT
jgi:hypothetical protein